MSSQIRMLRDAAFVVLQHLLPQHLLSRLTGHLARCRLFTIKDFLIRRFISAYGVDMAEAESPDPAGYAHFNAFFTRALKAGARPVDAEASAVTSPADGCISQIGELQDGRILQAKGQWFSAAELLASTEDAAAFENGSFVTVYLSPRDYHRVHMPLAARLSRLRYVPGRLFSVNEATAAGVPRLFARNERLVCHFETAQGPMALVMVGAMIVAGIETVWTGAITPTGRSVLDIDYGLGESKRNMDKATEMGRFLLGSTVILLFPRNRVRWAADLSCGTAVRMGRRIGDIVE